MGRLSHADEGPGTRDKFHIADGISLPGRGTSPNVDLLQYSQPEGVGRVHATNRDAKGGKRTTVLRKGGGKVWEDQTLLEWNPCEYNLYYFQRVTHCLSVVPAVRGRPQ